MEKYYRYFILISITIYTLFIIDDYAYFTILMLLLIWKATFYFPSFIIIFKVIFAGLIMGCFLYLFSSWNMFLLIIAAVIVYFVALYLVGGIKKQEILMLFGK